MEHSLTKNLVTQLKNKAITDADRHRAALHVIDWLGCCSLAKKSSVAAVYQAYVDSELAVSASDNAVLGNKNDTHVIFGNRCYWQDALMINGALGNVLEMDDIHRSSILHPGPVVIPAVLTIAQKHKLPMRNFLNAIVLGYEITIRLGEAIGRSHYQYFHNTATCAAFGAALAVSHLLNLSIEQAVSALGNVGSRTGGLWQMRNEKVLTKQWHNAEATKSGVMAAVLAKQGLSGPEYILEGPQGVFNALSQDANPDKFIAHSDTWRLYDCSFKPWPACRHAHPAIDTTLAVMNKVAKPLAIDDISKVTIYTYADAALFCDRLTPETELQAKFSIQHAVAAVICWGEPKLSHYHVESFDVLKSIRAKVTVVVQAEIEQKYPKHYGAKCEITLKSGETVSVEQTDTLGDPERPLSTEQIKAKASMLMTAAEIEPDNIADILAMKWADDDDLSQLNELIRLRC